MKLNKNKQTFSCFIVSETNAVVDIETGERELRHGYLVFSKFSNPVF